MKRYLCVLFFFVFSITLVGLSVESMAAGGFKKYEDWEDTTMYPAGFNDWANSEKWDFSGDTNACDVTVVDDYDGSRQVKFHYKQVPDKECYLEFNDCPERIVGIKADVTIDSCGGDQDCVARIAWHRGVSSDDQFYVEELIQLRPNAEGHDNGYFFTAGSKRDQNNGNALEEVFFRNDHNFDIATLQKTYTVTAIFDKPDQLTVTIEGQGTIIDKFSSKISGPIDLFKAIGMTVWSTTGTTNRNFDVYFDNIYIKTKGNCDKKAPTVKKIEPSKNVELNQKTFSITFSEPMQNCCSNITPPDGWTITETGWSDDRKTYTFTRTAPVEDLDPKTTYEFVVNPDKTGFKDIKGNAAKKKTVKIKTKKADS